jgi:hypothetical protein
VFLRRRIELRKVEPRLRSYEGTRKHISKGTKSNEGQSGTIYNANINIDSVDNGIGSQTYHKGTTYDISTRESTKGAKAKN